MSYFNALVKNVPLCAVFCPIFDFNFTIKQ